MRRPVLLCTILLATAPSVAASIATPEGCAKALALDTSLRINNQVSIQSARFDSTINALVVAWTYTTPPPLAGDANYGCVCGLDSLVIGAPDTAPVLWNPCHAAGDSVRIELGEGIRFQTRYYVAIRLQRRTGGDWGPVSNTSSAAFCGITTPSFTWEPIRYFAPPPNDTVWVFNEHVALWPTAPWSFGNISVDTLVYAAAGQLPAGLVAVGPLISFRVGDEWGSLLFSLRLTYDTAGVPAGFPQTAVRIFSLSNDTCIAQAGNLVDTVSGTVQAHVKIYSRRFFAAVDTVRSRTAVTIGRPWPTRDTNYVVEGGDSWFGFSMAVAGSSDPSVQYPQPVLDEIRRSYAALATWTLDGDTVAGDTAYTYHAGSVDSVTHEVRVVISRPAAGDTSFTWHIIVNQMPFIGDPPTLISPSDNAQVTGANILLWSQNAEARILSDTLYSLQIRTSSGILVDLDSIPTTNFRLADIPGGYLLPTLTPLYWRVATTGYDGQHWVKTLYSNEWSFVLIEGIGVLPRHAVFGARPGVWLQRSGDHALVCYRTPRDGTVQLDYFDLRGKRRQLVNGWCRGGVHTVALSGPSETHLSGLVRLRFENTETITPTPIFRP